VVIELLIAGAAALFGYRAGRRRRAGACTDARLGQLGFVAAPAPSPAAGRTMVVGYFESESAFQQAVAVAARRIGHQFARPGRPWSDHGLICVKCRARLTTAEAMASASASALMQPVPMMERCPDAGIDVRSW
jgi:hypothetical protein